MSQTTMQGVTVNVDSGGGGRQRGPGLFSNLGRAPWYVQLALLIVIGAIVIFVGVEILAKVYDFTVPTLLDFLVDPRAAGAGIGSALSAYIGGLWSTTGGRAYEKANNTRLYRFINWLPSSRIANSVNEYIWGSPGSGRRGGGGGGGF